MGAMQLSYAASIGVERPYSYYPSAASPAKELSTDQRVLLGTVQKLLASAEAIEARPLPPPEHTHWVGMHDYGRQGWLNDRAKAKGYLQTVRDKLATLPADHDAVIEAKVRYEVLKTKLG
jgi:hypothetical protein